MKMGMDLDTVIVKSALLHPYVDEELEVIRIETHAGEVRFIFPTPKKSISPVSLLGKRMVEVVLDIYGENLIWHPFWCRCSGCQDVARMEAAYDAETDRQWDAWCAR